MGPYIVKKFDEFVEIQKAQGWGAVILESAIIFEKDVSEMFDVIITVVADKQTRLKRTMLRDGLSEEMVLAKMNNQFSDDYKIKNSEIIIINEDMPNINTKFLLEKQVEMVIDLFENPFF
jgi:dephospho-CoA kinase